MRVVNIGPSQYTQQFYLDPHLMLSGQGSPLLPGEVLDVFTAPRKIDGINLVRVRRANGTIGEVYYCDLAGRCSLDPTPRTGGWPLDMTPSPKQGAKSVAKSGMKQPPPKRPTAWDRLMDDDE